MSDLPSSIGLLQRSGRLRRTLTMGVKTNQLAGCLIDP
ncbi:hypothetical protein R69608_06266 [Paraburkholderia nemoris]|uniref:Uncharacterized protein n=1 Tax=Paraburkholderia nemoris TaxID=2793076 RepID=A0ABN7N490_9BURK|nr:hypothetical protein R69619_06380 [Paraburkholderia nemoris]CAE6842787.1 hypothetical protein R75777_07155 [Paraburkholderia nemoris]CAE6851008.1 hypothetical protein R69776_07499 [Paraburkholderia nemoris]CAE6860055.1 hypothetical protein R69749_05394 [Paraburkholderia domus]CAE6958040.1 hypothetical protein R69608_06266 [Paraburkholderia nemoris]